MYMSRYLSLRVLGVHCLSGFVRVIRFSRCLWSWKYSRSHKFRENLSHFSYRLNSLNCPEAGQKRNPFERVLVSSGVYTVLDKFTMLLLNALLSEDSWGDARIRCRLSVLSKGVLLLGSGRFVLAVCLVLHDGGRKDIIASVAVTTLLWDVVKKQAAGIYISRSDPGAEEIQK